MSINQTNTGREHSQVEAYFRSSTGYWTSVYEDRDVASVIFQDRKDLVLSIVNDLQLEPDSQVLDIGCGAGHLAVELAQHFIVEAADNVGEMLEITRDRAAKAGLEHRLNVRAGDANQLSYDSASFHLVIAIGVLPWIRNTTKPLTEFARVLRPGGYLIVSIDNTWALNRLFDPILNPLLEPLKRFVRIALEGAGILRKKVRPFFDSSAKLDRSAEGCGFAKLGGRGLGFGPMSFLTFKILSGPAGIKLHRWLQHAAGRGNRLVSFAGSHYILTAKRLEGSSEFKSKE